MLTYRTAARHSEPQPREAYLAKRRKALYASGGFSDRLVPQRLSWLHSEQIPRKPCRLCAARRNSANASRPFRYCSALAGAFRCAFTVHIKMAWARAHA